MKNKSKIFRSGSLALALLMALTLLSACTSNLQEGQSSDESVISSQITESITISSEESSSREETVSSKTETSSKLPVSSSSVSSNESDETGKNEEVTTSKIPAFSGKAFVVINGNVPSFSKDELKAVGYESYAALDNLGRTRTALASVGKDTMPKPDEERGSISSIKPSGWKQAKYSSVSGGWLYNRCHLIGWQLSAENANKGNLITGTKYLNIEGMLPFENMVADYIKETGNHVAYRITPIYEGDNLLASGVQMEAYSVEDDGEGICFNVYCYNVQPGININYATGESRE